MNTLISDEPLMQQTLGRIAVEVPGATALFRQHKLDFCCNGNRTLAQACAERELDPIMLTHFLQVLRQQEVRQEPISDPAALVEHILQRYHETHRHQLPELVRMARRVEAVHRDHPEMPNGLADFLDMMEQELLNHMGKEEQILFPMMLKGWHGMANGPISVMRHEHMEHGDLLERLVELTTNHTPPPDACTTWRALYAGTERLMDDLMHHIHLENNVLFPMFERRN
jgi:regulator of cell morphogenesis and NO signaling